MVSVLLADDQALVRSGFTMILRARDDMTVVGEAADGVEAVALAKQALPDVILMDARMPRMNGIEATQELVDSGITSRIIILTTFDVDDLVYGALRAGASGFLLKDIRPDELVDAVRVVAEGNALLAPTVTRRLLNRFATTVPRNTFQLSDLTEREREVLALVARGLSNTEISSHLELTVATVKAHVSAVLRKYQLRDRVQAVVLAYDHGLVEPRRTD